MKLEFSGQIFEKYSDYNLSSETAELLHADRRTDRDIFANAPKNGVEKCAN